VIVQIYPLLAAGCEVYEKEDRQWVDERWQAMASRMCIGNIDRCWEVMREVWSRRDAAKAEKTAVEKGKQQHDITPAMVNAGTQKRKPEEELNLQDSSSLSNMLNGISTQTMERKRGRRQIGEDIDSELTVKGRFHWVSVMKDWEWEPSLR
jgi:hypothetical protein